MRNISRGISLITLACESFTKKWLLFELFLTPRLLAAARQIHIKREESEEGEGEGGDVVRLPPDALGSSKDNPFLISSDDEADKTKI